MRLRLPIALIIAAGIAAVLLWPRGSSRVEAPPKLGMGKITAFRLNPDVQESMKNLGHNDTEFFHSWPVLKSSELSEDQAARLRAIVQDPDTYGVSDKKCFEPGAAFRIEDENSPTELLLSLECKQARVIVRHSAVSKGLSEEGAEEFKRFFDAVFAGK